MKRRVTLHSGRSGRSGIFRAGHNDRAHGMENADHVDSALSKNNVYRHIGSGEFSFEQAELKFYRKHFWLAQLEKNDRYLEQRHPERVKSIEDVYKDKKTAPEEVILQLGTRDQPIQKAQLDKIMMEQIAWEQKTFPQLQYLSYALHVDEPNAAYHVSARRTWIAHDKKGLEIPNERRALEEMGIQRPNLILKESRYNNAKMTFTRKCREHLQTLCRQYGLEIETQPRERGKSGRSLDELKTETAMKDLDAIRAKTNALGAEIEDLEKKKRDLTAEIKTLEIRGDESKMIDALEKAAKEKPITEGFIDKKIIGYKVSAAWVAESLRLARVGLQAADERAKKEEAESAVRWAKIEANVAKKEAAEAATAAKEAREREISLSFETLDFREASPELREKFSAAVDRERQQQKEKQQEKPKVQTKNFSR